MVKIRLVRVGKRNSPSFKVVVVNSREKSRGAKFIEEIGFFNPMGSRASFDLSKERYDYWLKQGAQSSESVANLIKGEYRFVHYKPKKEEKQKEKKEVSEQEIKENA